MSEELQFISLRNDLLFHMVFTKNEKALKSLISVLLGISVSSISKIEILNPMQYSDMIDTKLTILDLKVHMNDSTFILIEMQVRKFTYWSNRCLAYGCRQVADQVTKDFDYSLLQPVIQISIMDYSLFPDAPVFFEEYVPRNAQGRIFSDKLRFLVMDLTQISKATEEQKDQGLVKWANAFRAESWEQVNSINDPGVKEAAKTMEMIMSNPTERELIRMRQDALIDWRTMINSERKEAAEEAARRGKIEGAVEAYQEFGASIEDTIKRIASKFGLSQDDSSRYVHEFWKVA